MEGANLTATQMTWGGWGGQEPSYSQSCWRRLQERNQEISEYIDVCARQCIKVTNRSAFCGVLECTQDLDLNFIYLLFFKCRNYKMSWVIHAWHLASVRQKTIRAPFLRRCLCCYVLIFMFISEAPGGESRAKKEERMNSMWWNLCTWERWNLKSLSKEEWPWIKKSTLRNNKTSRSGLSCSFLSPFFPPVVDLSFHLSYCFTLIGPLRALHDATATRVEDLTIHWNMNRVFSFKRSHHFIGFN